MLFDEDISSQFQKAILNLTNKSDIDSGQEVLNEMVHDFRRRFKNIKMTIDELDEGIFMKYVAQKPTARSRLEGPFFRGVAKNGKTGWQIMCMIRGTSIFIGTVDNVNMAALIYDLIAIQSNGLNLKSNLSYSKLDIIAVLSIE